MEVANITGNSQYVDDTSGLSANITLDQQEAPHASNASSSSLVLNIHLGLMLTVIIPGLACNLLSLLVFMASAKLRRTTTGHYLVALALADLFFLVGDLMRWQHSFRKTGLYLPTVDVMLTSDIACQFVHFVRYASKLSSAWITVAITLERFLTVAFPLKVATISTPFKAKLTILFTYCACAALGSFPFWTLKLMKTEWGVRCQVPSYSFPTYNVWSWVVLRIGSLLLPGACIIVLSSLLIHRLLKVRTSRLRRLRVGYQPGESSAASRLERQLTAMLLAVAVAFIVLRLPYTILYYINKYKEEIWIPLDPDLSYRISFANKMADVLATTNYAVNFFLYCMCGSAFRKQFRLLLACTTVVRPAGSSTTRTRSFALSNLVPSSIRRWSWESGDRHSVDKRHSLEKQSWGRFTKSMNAQRLSR